MKRLFITALRSPRSTVLLSAAVATSSTLLYHFARPIHASAAAPNNRIYFPVRYDYEFDSLALLPTPLLANFTLRGDVASDRLTAALIRIVSYETDLEISAVDIEVDEPTTRDLMYKYNVNKIPTIVALKGGIPIGSYTLPDDFKEVDWQDFKQWIESMATK